MKAREVYPNAPIVLMAVEVRHTQCEPLDRRQVTQMSGLLRDIFPLPGEISEVSVEFQGAAQPVQQVVSLPRWTTRDKRTALTVRQNALVLETTQYGSYERVKSLFHRALEARASVERPAGVDRIGLRYIDEIRVPLANSGQRPDWNQWINSALLGPVEVESELGLSPVANEGLVVYSGAENTALVLRYGAQDQYAVQSTSDLRRPLPPPGPLFKLDIDSFWQAGEEVPEFEVGVLLEQADLLHKPVGGVFESMISERLRREVLRNG
ncbi:TIGR04255 family protein [Leifsonia sp. C5G2]|uniref:TIGR04255 family protein n=1 Tax=Leifsonia sp. C5G2 TaxID=2735269 RepID=UPI00158453F0|nr:TIGR04255 family protein [Leifsonia sp. C5G2]